MNLILSSPTGVVTVPFREGWSPEREKALASHSSPRPASATLSAQRNDAKFGLGTLE